MLVHTREGHVPLCILIGLFSLQRYKTACFDDEAFSRVKVRVHVIMLSNMISTPVQVIGHRPYGIQSDLPCMSWRTITYCNRYVLDQLNIFQ